MFHNGLLHMPDRVLPDGGTRLDKKTGERMALSRSIVVPLSARARRADRVPDISVADGNRLFTGSVGQRGQVFAH
ncbi:hypothetical protein MRP14_04400, partial [Dickeya dianthicola]|uniref:hypothetical protein n=1 Tax=Dickeya dianthicola TaxID=204039 RepID=UPI001F61A805